MAFTLLMAVSADGFLAKGPDDDMRWTTRTDKSVFRLLTLSSGQPLLAGRRTAELLPKLHGRKVVTLSRTHHRGITLQEAAWSHKDAWLIGGNEAALAAVEQNMVDRAILCHSPVNLGGGIPAAQLVDYLDRRGKEVAFTLGDIALTIYTDVVQHGS